MLYIVGLGLGDERDITLKGLDAIKSSTRVYLEAYTSILGVSHDNLERLYGKPIIVADRDMVETESDDILKDADKEDVSFLVVGDPFGATTHADLVLRAKELSVPVKVIHNASIMNAVGCTGLALYNFGQTVSIPFFTATWKPDSWLHRIKENWTLGLHTLCLLDIKVKEQSEENLARGRKIFEPPRYMSSTTALQQVLELLDSEQEPFLDPATTLCVSVSQVGSPSQKIVAATIKELAELDDAQSLGGPLHSLVIVGRQFHPLERDFLKQYALDVDRLAETAKHAPYSLS